MAAMMKLCGALVLFLTVSIATGLRCYSCISSRPESCTNAINCASPFNKCYSVKVGDLVNLGCGHTSMCVSPYKCCSGDLCNSAFPAGPSVMLLLVSSAILTLFL
ncbi:lymphocyte antigen 6G-like [Melanotaenia boesemani]|uniref:lymphocyte antigen 6G-like n=1 Tax=Melanotaenia boesemani TaxID=1250792 RepID=UPI001C046131|nr:lymphocyte antigen 6G-like [Melanotaenia boesemani]